MAEQTQVDFGAVTRMQQQIWSKGDFAHVALNYDGSGKAAGIRLFLDGKPAALETVRDNLSGSIRTTAPLAIGSGFSSPAISALISRLSRAEDQGGTLGIGQSAAAVGRILGPESGTFTYSRLSPAFPYLAGAVVMAIAAAVGSTVRRTPPDA